MEKIAKILLDRIEKLESDNSKRLIPTNAMKFGIQQIELIALEIFIITEPDIKQELRKLCAPNKSQFYK